MLSDILGMLSILRTTLATALMPGVKSRLAKIIFLLLTRKSKLITNFLKIFEFSIFAREKIPTEVKNRVLSLMVDIVTKRGRSILGFSVQYVLNGKHTVRSIGMIELYESHTGVYLADVIVKRLKEFCIELHQVITITTDNGANVLKMIRDLECHLHKAIEITDLKRNPVELKSHLDLQFPHFEHCQCRQIGVFQANSF